MSSYTSTMLKLERMTQATNAQQMEWQEKMSGQSHQLEVADLVKAGLNPVLSSGGSGAQSYTTSLDSGANAIANTYSAHESAAATRYAARQSAAATRAAAYAQLEAARLGYNANIYSTDKGYELGKYKADMSYKTAIDTPVKSIGGFIDKFANKAGLYDLFGTTTVKGLVGKSKLLLNDPAKFFKEVPQGAKIMINNFKLNSKGQKQVGSALKSIGIKNTSANRNLFVKAFVFGNKSAQNKLMGLVPYRQNNSSRTINGRMNRAFY